MSFPLADEYVSTKDAVIRVFTEKDTARLNDAIEHYLASVDHQLLDVK